MWTGYVDKYGYGRFRVASQKVGAHRVAYELFNGVIPTDMQVDHICFNRSCVNPEHLQLLSPAENKKRRKIRVDKVCKNGHDLYNENTIVRKDGSVKCRICENKRQREWIKNKRNLAKAK